MRFLPSFSAWRARRALRGYIDPKLVREFVNNPDMRFPPPRHCQLNFILILLRDDNLDELPHLVRRVTEVVPDSTGWIERLAGSLIVITFGLVQPNAEAPAKRIETVERLLRSLGDRIKLLHGQSVALAGSLTSRGSRFPYFGSAFQNFGAMLQTLTTLQFGESLEFRSSAGPTPP